MKSINPFKSKISISFKNTVNKSACVKNNIIAGSSNVYRMCRERSTRFNLTTTSSQRRPSTNSRKLQMCKSPMSKPAPARKPRTVLLVCQPWASPLWLAIRILASGYVELNPGPQRRQQLAGLVRLALSQTSVRWSDDTDFSYSRELMVQPCGGSHTTCWGLLEAERGPA